MTFNSHRYLFIALGCGLISGLIMGSAAGLRAQDTAAQTAPAASGQQQAQPAAGQDSGQDADPLKRQRSDKERLAAQKAVRQELKGAYKTWLNQDVVWIITD